ncbi:MAG: VWA domain-containing protein, partial [Pseudomonadota bacterium]
MSHLKHFKICIFLFALVTFNHALATGLHPVNTDAPVQILHVSFDVDIQGKYASSVMEVRFIAAHRHENAANMRFPLPPNSVIHKAEIFLTATETWMQAETVGRREGENVFNDITQSQPELDPLLIQQIGKDFYRARVFPITAAGDLRIRIHYAHLLENNGDDYVLRIPFANPDATAATPARGVDVSVTFDDAWQTSGSWSIGEAGALPSDVVDTNQVQLALNDFTLDTDLTLPLMAPIPLPEAGALQYQSQTHDILHTWWRPGLSALPGVIDQPRNVVFVIDVSGSMSGDKLAQTRQAIINVLNELNAEDYFGIVAFDNQVYPFRENMLSGENIQEATAWVAALQALGSTAISAGLTKGAAIGVTSPLSNAPIDLLLITDGRPNVGSSTSAGILADIGMEADQLGQQVRIFSVGIGHNLDQNLLNELASNTGGESIFALDDGVITGEIVDLFSRIKGGGIGDASIRIGDGQRLETYTQKRVFPGDEFQLGIQDAMATSTSLKFEGIGTNFSRHMIGAAISLVETGSDGIHLIAVPLAAKTWADRLEQQADNVAETAELVDEAVRLARTYGIVTRYSSLLALETEELYAQHNIERIERNAAGIALQPVSGSSVDEDRLGGSGTNDNIGTNLPNAGPVLPPTTLSPSIGLNDLAAFAPDSNLASVDAPTIFCENPRLDSQLFLYIPRVVFQGIELWVSLRLVRTS